VAGIGPSSMINGSPLSQHPFYYGSWFQTQFFSFSWNQLTLMAPSTIPDELPAHDALIDSFLSIYQLRFGQTTYLPSFQKLEQAG
jgi:hypothetical protein